MRLPTWKFRNAEEDRDENRRQLHEAAWPDMFANLQSAYAELTNAQFELERRTAEISETRDLFQQVISSMSEALFLTDRSGRVIRANPAAATLLECQETSILGRPLTAVCGSDDIPATPWKLMEIAPTGRITNLDADLSTLGGSTIPVSFSLGLMHDKQNKITGVLAVARDMREQRSLINSLVVARTRFQELLEFAPDAIVLANQDGEIVLVNTQTERLFGYKRDELLGKSVEVLVPERLRGQVPEPATQRDDSLLDLDEALLTGNLSGSAEQVEFYLLDRDGREFPAEITRRQIETEDGLLVMSLIRDITERKRAETARHAAESRYQELFDNANDIVYTHDLEGNFKSLNRTAEKLTGYSLKEALQMNMGQLVVPEYLPEAQQRIMDHVMGKSDLPPFELEIIRKDGVRMPIEVSTRLVMENGQPVAVQGIARDIAERRRVESAHVAAEARYHSLFDNANDLIYTHDLNGNFQTVNPMSERITGYGHDEAMQMNIGQIIAPEYLPMVMERVMRQVQGEEFKEPLQLEIICKDQSRLALEIHTRVLLENGMPAGMQGIARDVTERKRAEDAVREATAVQRAILDYAGYGIISSTTEGVITTFNPAAERMLGYTAEEMVHKQTPAIFHDLSEVVERAQVFSRELGQQIEPGFEVLVAKARLDLPNEHEWTYIRKDGTRVPVSLSVTALRDGEGDINGFIGLASDITQRKQSEQLQARLNRQAALRADVGAALTDETNTLQQMLQQCSEAVVEHLDAAYARIWLLNEAGDVLELQSSAGMHTNVNDPQAKVPVGQFRIGKIAEEKAPHLTNDVPNDPHVGDREWAEREGMQAFAGYPLMLGERLVGVMAMFSRQKLEADTLNALALIADTIVHGVERKRAEDERQTLLDREHEARMVAENASRLKDDFLAMISHELRAPLTAILGWAQMLRSGSLDRTSAERALTTIERNAKSQAHLVGDLLDASRIATGKLGLEVKPVELMSVVDAAVDAVRPSVEAKSIRMQIVMEPWVGPFVGDHERLKQVVWNLLSNAIKFTPAGGLIEVRLERLEQKALLIVSDTGQGIDPEFLPHIFDRFRQADSSSKRQQGGLGLGLAIVKHIVELHGGAIYAYSRGEGQGSDFMITLPLAAKEAESKEGSLWPESLPENQVRLGNLRGVKVLVVDDEHDTREVLSVMLARYGTEVRAAGSVREALQVLSVWKPDMLVSDIGMPDEDGYVMIRKLRALSAEEGGELPAVALTAFASPADREKALAAGFQRHLAKPVEPVELAKIVARVLGRSEEGITL
ncbi:MAG: PAS domain S-box protein [Blastocatellia bacterium]